jgi:phosphotransferase system  glucose/maltose/N-acetylglucosamine-specific IIC component
MRASVLAWMRDVAFYLGMGALFSHELDAIPNHEWRGLPLLATLPDDTAMWLFIAAHVPLFAILVALVASRDERIRGLSRLGIGAFLVVHGLLHALSASEPTYEFSSRLSRLLIFGGAALGALYLALAWLARTRGDANMPAEETT